MKRLFCSCFHVFTSSFWFRIAGHQIRKCSNYVFFFKKYRIDRLGDRHFDAVTLGQLPHALRGGHTLGDAVHRIEDLLQLASLADALADGAVAALGADASGDQIAQTSKAE